MRAAALALLLALPVWAGAPVKVMLQPGQPAPVRGCFQDSDTCTRTGQEIAQLRRENAELREATVSGASPGAVTAAVLVAAAIAFGLGFTLGQAATKGGNNE